MVVTDKEVKPSLPIVVRKTRNGYTIHYLKHSTKLNIKKLVITLGHSKRQVVTEN